MVEIERLTSKAGQPDALSQVLGDRRFKTNHLLPDLTRQLYPQQKGHAVTVSRYYLLRTPPVMVDYEQPPQFGKMHCEEKRRWCHANGVVYLPIFLREKLRPAQLKVRLDDETGAMQRGKEDASSAAVVEAAFVVEESSLQALIEAEVLGRLHAEEGLRGAKYGGFARTNRLQVLCAAVAKELKTKAADGSLGYELRSRELAVVAG